MPSHSESYSRGFDHGNYGNAYETSDWEAFVMGRHAETPEGLDETEYRAGMLLGFFSSYEIHEIPGEVADEVERLRAKYRPGDTCACTRGTFCDVAHEPTICQCGKCPKPD